MENLGQNNTFVNNCASAIKAFRTLYLINAVISDRFICTISILMIRPINDVACMTCQT